jgi:hypothetical protein
MILTAVKTSDLTPRRLADHKQESLCLTSVLAVVMIYPYEDRVLASQSITDYFIQNMSASEKVINSYDTDICSLQKATPLDHDPSPQHDGTADESNKSCECSIFVLYNYTNRITQIQTGCPNCSYDSVAKDSVARRGRTQGGG